MFPFPEEPRSQDEFGQVADLVALCGRQSYGDDDEVAEAAPDAEELHAGLDMPFLDHLATKVQTECGSLLCQLLAHACAALSETAIAFVGDCSGRCCAGCGSRWLCLLNTASRTYTQLRRSNGRAAYACPRSSPYGHA